MSYPENLRQNIQYLTNYSRNVVKILSNNSRDNVVVQSGAQVSFTMPPNSLINLDDFCVNATFQATPAGADAANTRPRYLTRNANSLIQRMVIECQGQTVFDVQDYNIINQIFSDYQKGIESTFKNLLNNPDCLQHYADDGTPCGIYSLVTAQNPNAIYDKKPIVLSQFVGFLSGSPSYIDTSITGNITITLYLAPASHVLFNALDILPAGAAALNIAANNTPQYELTGIYATITKATIDDGIYFESVANAMRSGMPFSLKYNHYHTITGNACNKTTNFRYEVSGKSVDMAIFTFLHNNRGTIDVLKRDNATDEDFQNVDAYTGSAVANFKGNSKYLANL
eukprot:765033-Hanusia_phi.AAC.2